MLTRWGLSRKISHLERVTKIGVGVAKCIPVVDVI